MRLLKIFVGYGQGVEARLQKWRTQKMFDITSGHLELVMNQLKIETLEAFQDAISDSRAPKGQRLSRQTARNKIKDGGRLNATGERNYRAALQRLGYDPKKPMTVAQDPLPQQCIPSFLTGQDLIKKPNQDALFDAMVGIYRLYRHHSDGGQLIVETVFVAERDNENVICYLINRSGYVYRGHAYKSVNIIYFFFFRPDSQYQFATRTIFADAPRVGVTDLAEGVMLRVTNTDGHCLRAAVLMQRCAEFSVDGGLDAMRSPYPDLEKFDAPQVEILQAVQADTILNKIKSAFRVGRPLEPDDSAFNGVLKFTTIENIEERQLNSTSDKKFYEDAEKVAYITLAEPDYKTRGAKDAVAAYEDAVKEFVATH